MDYGKTSAIILAAGSSQRMGRINKLLIPIEGQPLVRRTVEQYCHLGMGQIVVVLGYQHARIRAALVGLDIDTVVNHEFAHGQRTSIHCGLTRLSEQADTVLIGLADQPWLTSDDILYLCQTFDQRASASMLVPYHQNTRGNPILLAAEQARVVDAQGVHLGCRNLTKKYPEQVWRLPVQHRRYHCDLDTLADVRQVLGEGALTEVSPL